MGARVSILLRKGASVNEIDEGKTVLHHVVEREYESVAAVLLKWGAPADAVGNDKTSPLDLAWNSNLDSMTALLIDYTLPEM